MPRDWQPVAGRPFDGHLDDQVRDITLAMYGVAHGETGRIGSTTFGDAHRTSVAGRNVVIANAWTPMDPQGFRPRHGTPAVAVCAVELPSLLPILLIRSRQFSWHMKGESQTGNPAFDAMFQVIAMPDQFAARSGLSTAQDVLTPQVQQLIMAHDDWMFCAERYLFGCVGKGAFGSLEEADFRASEVLAIVAAIPGSVLPSRVDHSADALLARFSQIDTIDGAIAELQRLTPAERELLARSDTPLAAFADVRTPEDAIARFQALDPQARMQIMAMFMRVQDGN